MDSRHRPDGSFLDLVFESGFGVEALVVAAVSLSFFAFTITPWLFFGVALVVILLGLATARNARHG